MVSLSFLRQNIELCFPAFGLNLQPDPGMSGGNGQHFRFDLPPGVRPEILLHSIPIPRPTIPPRCIPSEYRSSTNQTTHVISA